LSAVDIIEEQLAAFNARDLERFVVCFTDDFELADAHGNVIAQRHAGIRAVYGQLFAQSPQLHVDVRNRIHAGDWTVDHEHVTGFVMAGFPEENDVLVAHHVADGRINRSLFLL
jgi:hypothetical protein